MSDIDLQKLFDFDEEDLTANRSCKVSPRQEKRIQEAERLSSRIFRGTGLVLILLAVSNAYGVISSAIKQGWSFSTASQNDMIGIITSIGIPGLLLGFFASGSFKMAAAKADHSVQQVRGKVHFIRVEKVFPEKKPNGSMAFRTVEVYELRVGKVHFDNVSQQMMSIMEEGDIYAFYYTKDTKDILSAERITKGK